MLESESILLCHYHFPPLKNGGVYRNYFLSVAVSKFAKNIFVITSDNTKILPKEEFEFPSNFVIHTSFTFDYRTLIGYYLKYLAPSDNASSLKENNKSSKFVQYLIKIQRSFPFSIVLSEGSIAYVINSFLKAKDIIEDQNIKVIYSSFMPYADHIICFLLKRKFPHLIWVADFRDLHVEPIYKNTIWPNLQKKVEKFLLKNADVVTTVSEGITSKMSLLHPNVHTLLKGVTFREQQANFPKFTFAYTGSLFLHYRDPKPLFFVLQKLINDHTIFEEDIQFIYAGKDEITMRQWANECGVEQIFVSKGLCSRKDAINIQDKSHINVLLTSSSDDHEGLLTGKLFEYIESGREILCIVNGSKDREIERFFNTYQLGKVAYSALDIETYVVKKYHEWKATGLVLCHQDTSKIEENLSWHSQAEKLVSLVESVNFANRV